MENTLCHIRVFSYSLSISRVLSGVIIYLVCLLPNKSSGYRSTSGLLFTCRPPCSRQGLPPIYVTVDDCELLPHSFHLFLYINRGSFVSVALSLGLPPVAVSDCRILRCPDFPLSAARAKRPLSRLPLHYTLNFHIIPNKKP